MKVTVNKTEYKALNDLRGLPAEAHMLVMCSESTTTGGTLEGSAEAFEELVSFIGEEIADDMHSAARTKALVSLCLKIDPDCGKWLGM